MIPAKARNRAMAFEVRHQERRDHAASKEHSMIRARGTKPRSPPVKKLSEEE